MLNDATKRRVVAALATRLPERPIEDLHQVGVGRGVFGEIVQVTFADRGPSLVVKLADAGPNGDAARRAGAYEREALAYRSLLALVDVRRPACLGIVDDPLGPTLLLEDLSGYRFVDQLDGLELDDAFEVVASLGRMHRTAPDPIPAAVRVNTVAGFDREQLNAGLEALRRQWGHIVPDRQRHAFAALVEDHDGSGERFAQAGPHVLCHGDPRADNLAFDGPHSILFDWQQIAVQPGVGDLAWLAATSLEPALRRDADEQLVGRYRQSAEHEITLEDYRAGFILPGLAVLYLAQRKIDDERTGAFIATSLRRIGEALVDLDVAGR